MKNRNILFIGDSLTEWGNWSTLFPDAEIMNLGKAGDTTTDILSRMSEIISQHPSKIFLMIGINDLGNGESVSSVANNLEEILKQLRKSWESLSFFVYKVLPIGEDSWVNTSFNNAKINELNIEIKRLAGIYNCTLIDMSKSFSAFNGRLHSTLTNDGLHLNEKGYQTWKNEIAEYIIH